MNDKIDILRMTFGIVLILALIGLAAAIALGKVEEKSSYGLHDIIAVLGTLSGAFCGWAFGNRK